jgi:thiamine biosynthesis lipoprotein
LWKLYAEHFAKDGADPEGPSPATLRNVLAKVDSRAITVTEHTISFSKPGMAVTLNGIAQGFITDRIAQALRERGFQHVLVDMGEMRALRGHPTGAPWRIGIADPVHPWRQLETIDLVEKAVSTSGGYGMTFDASGRHHHLFDPRTGRSANHYLSVSVVADNATLADALSTALSILPPDEATRIVSRYNVSALLVDAERNVYALGIC